MFEWNEEQQQEILIPEVMQDVFAGLNIIVDVICKRQQELKK
jgi:hypothetical protein